MKNDTLMVGVVYAPFLNELFSAERGKGAYLNGKRIHVSSITALSKCYIVSCEGSERTKRIAQIDAYFHPKVNDLRKLGSAALEGCWVASGRAEAYIVTRIYPWDVAAAVLIAREAGGNVTFFDGKPWQPICGDVVFSNGNMHGKIVKRLRTILT
jgi:myo-inositol-1(or 4)-monophosphatase